MAVVDPEEFWRKTINDLSASLPSDGNTAPDIENIAPTIKKVSNDGKRKVLVHKVITQIYVFTDMTGKVYTANTSQKMQIIGEMTLARALKMAQEDNFS